jgi:predicted Fe-Mo cluster-binding NifX family protein
MTSTVDARFGRARFFIVVDTGTGKFSAHDNAQNLNAMQGAGIQAAEDVINMDVDAVVTGKVGPRAFRTLRAGGVGIYIGAAGLVKNALEQFSADELQPASEPKADKCWNWPLARLGWFSEYSARVHVGSSEHLG